LSTVGPFRRADYAKLPDEPRCELIYGSLYLPPSNSPLHQTAVSLLCRRLDVVATELGGTCFVAPLDTVLSDHTVVQPDVLFLSPGRMTALTNECLEGAPDLVVEVLGLGSARRDRALKLRAYAEFGVREYWLLDPALAHVDFLLNVDGGFQVALPPDGTYRSPVLPQISIPLADFWAELKSRLPS
jgi:Uma2 family endonuclease